MDQLVWLLGCFGIAFVVQEKLPRPDWLPRILHKLLSCSFCVGFHVGWLSWLLLWLLTGNVLFGAPSPLYCIGWGFASGAFYYCLNAVIEWFER